MLRSRLGVIASAVLIVLGTAMAPALADGTSSPGPTVTPAVGGVFTVEVPGVGSLTFTVDPTTGAISNLVATAGTGFTAGSPTLSDEGVQVSFTGTTGQVTLVQAEVDHEDGSITVEPEVEQPEVEPPEVEQPEVEHGDTAEHAGATTSTTEVEQEDSTGVFVVPSSTTTSSPPTTEQDHSDSNQRDDVTPGSQAGESSAGSSGTGSSDGGGD